ncbi:hypothetical protein C5167_038688 [Papaver somniferum]|uniref:Lethal giant larvae (Lgl)-like C-terminal domain-containing protein n=1 Tax=Papaver somniferum TaxID=3469 RepID=A0A4Y7ID90_PAPSO|nr:hypothetical protein C5167_038688 [Papaver somniferum]
MFVKKLVEKASKKQPGGGSLSSLKSDDVNPRLVFHYGIPAGAIKLAYDSIQNILAISTKDGRIKLLGKENTQAILESSDPIPSKFLQFLENEGVLINVTAQNHIEVWDVERKQLSHVHKFKQEITAFTVIQHTSYIYIGDSIGNVSVWKVDQENHHILQMRYNIPLSVSHGNTAEAEGDAAVLYILAQPMAESKRVLVIFRDGAIVLWGVEESNVIFITGGNLLHSLSPETKKVTSACWACPYGSKVVVGYNNGEILLWAIPSLSDSKGSSNKDVSATQNVPTCKLNLGYKMDKIPISSLKWIYGDGKASRLYVNGESDSVTSNLFQIILLNEHTESRTIKLTLPLPERCLDMQIIPSTSDQNKHKHDSLILLLKSGHLCAYDDSAIERYLLQLHSKSTPSLPKQVMIKLPFVEPSITTAKLITDCTNLSMDEDYKLVAKSLPSFLPVEAKEKDGKCISSGFTKVKCLYITGHSDGSINFWDLSCPLFLPISSVKQQSEDNHSVTGIPVTALHFDHSSRLLVTGDQVGMVRIFKLKPDQISMENNRLSLQGSTKKNIIHSVKVIKVNGAVLSINLKQDSSHVAVGSDQGYISIIGMEGPTLLSQKQFTSELCTGVISSQFETCSFHGFENNVLLVATKDSSIVALDSDNGNTLSANTVHPNKPSKALFMQILDVLDDLVLLCNETSIYIYSLVNAVQGVKKVLYKKKFHGTSCCWATTVHDNNSNIAVILLFASGKIEIRSLPELTLLKETSITGLTVSNSKLNFLCASSGGELVVVNGDQEVFFVSLLLQKEIYRILDHISLVYKERMLVQQEVNVPVIHKEKKKGFFSSVMKGGKAKADSDVTFEEPRASVGEELNTIFSAENFPLDAENIDHVPVDNDDAELSIDDIDIDGEMEKPKGGGHNMIPGLNTQKLASRFQALTGKLKQKMVKNEKTHAKIENEAGKSGSPRKDEKNSSIDEIKKRYGFPSSGATSEANMAQSKLHENLRKLDGINVRTNEMEDTAKSFSALANEMLKTAEHDKRSS